MATEDKTQGSTATMTKDVCFLPKCGKPGVTITEVQVAPGVNTELAVCDEHNTQLEKAKLDAAERAKTSKIVINVEEDPENIEAPYGRCHVCKEPVGVFEPEMLMKDENQHLDLTKGIPIKWWMHASTYHKDKKEFSDGSTDYCHTTCRCRDKESTGYIRITRVVEVGTKNG